MSRTYSTMESDENTNYNCILPVEVLTHLFSFLKVNDRKKVRLTCRSWYNACNAVKLLQNEKLCIDTKPVNFDLVIDTLMKCPYSCMNLEFHEVVFNKYCVQFWEECGYRINSITFQRCSVSKEVLVNILLYCENLKYLTIERCDNIIDELESILSDNTISNFTNNSLIGLKLKSCNITDNILSKLLCIYSNIQKICFESLKINSYKRIDKRFYPELGSIGNSRYDSKDIFTMSCVFQEIKLREFHIQNLCFSNIGDKGLTNDWFRKIGSLPNLRLKKLTLKSHYLLSEDSFMNFFSNQTFLITVTILDCQNFTLQCALHLLRMCSDLKHLTIKINGHEKFILHQELFNVVQASRLVTFYLFSSNVHYPSFNQMKDFVENMNSSLRYWSSSIPLHDLLGQTIVKTYTNLSFLELNDTSQHGLTDIGLQAVFRQLVNLNVLKIQTHLIITDYGFTGQWQNKPLTSENRISIKQLTRLEDLSLTLLGPCQITNITFSDFVFPVMRRLLVTIKNEISEDSFLSMSKHIPLLEYFSVSAVNISYKSIIKCLDNWKNLLALQIHDVSGTEFALKLEMPIFDSIFRHTRTVRFLKLEPNVILCYDIFEKQWYKRIFKNSKDENEYLFFKFHKKYKY